MKISKAINILRKYLIKYGDINMAFISNGGEQSVVNNIDVMSIFKEDNEDEYEDIVIIRDHFDYNQFTGAEYDGEPNEKDWANGYPGYEITEKEVEDPDSDYWDSGCPIEDKKVEDKEDTESWIPWELM